MFCFRAWKGAFTHWLLQIDLTSPGVVFFTEKLHTHMHTGTHVPAWCTFRLLLRASAWESMAAGGGFGPRVNTHHAGRMSAVSYGFRDPSTTAWHRASDGENWSCLRTKSKNSALNSFSFWLQHYYPERRPDEGSRVCVSEVIKVCACLSSSGKSCCVPLLILSCIKGLKVAYFPE